MHVQVKSGFNDNSILSFSCSNVFVFARNPEYSRSGINQNLVTYPDIDLSLLYKHLVSGHTFFKYDITGRPVIDVYLVAK